MQDLKLILQKTEEMFPDHASESESLIMDIFPDITRKSFIVTLLIELDSRFKTYCEILREATGQSLKWSDLKGSPLERFITYSEKVCGLKSLYDDFNRQRLIGLIEVRNCIVHNNSSLEGFGKRKVIENFSRQVGGVTIEDDLISLELAGCNNCATIVFEFMERAYNSALDIFPR